MYHLKWFLWYHTCGFMFPIIVACFWNVVIKFLLTQFLFCRESTTACWERIILSNSFCKHKIFEWLKSLDCSLLPSAYDIHSVVDSVTNNEFIFQTQTLLCLCISWQSLYHSYPSRACSKHGIRKQLRLFVLFHDARCWLCESHSFIGFLPTSDLFSLPSKQRGIWT